MYFVKGSTMINKRSMIIVFTTLTFTCPVLPTTTEGKTCTVNSDGEHGLCLPLTECPQLWKSAKKKNETVLCGVEKQIPLVCCRLNSSESSPQAAIALSYVSSFRTQKSDDPISKQKCREYANLVYTGQEKKTEICKIRPEGRKVGRAELGEFPHMASLVYENQGDKSMRSWCGGSLISERFVLTAAHCLYPFKTEKLKWVLLGAVDIRNTSKEGQLIPIAQMIPHPDYNKPRLYFDVGLIQLKRAPILGPLLRPACLADDDESIASRELIITGWGKTGHGGDPSKDLLKAILIEAPYYICAPSYGPDVSLRTLLAQGIHNASMLCAGHPTGKSDSCQGDSGGPLQLISTDPHCTYKVVGVTSFGKRCGTGIERSGPPSVYSRVQYFRKWIEDIVWR